MSKRFELINLLNAHDKFRDNDNNKELDSFDVIDLLNCYDKLQILLTEKEPTHSRTRRTTEKCDCAEV